MVNWFEEYYPELIEYASKIVYKKNLSAEPADLVNDAYIKLFDSGEEFSLKLVKTFISTGSWVELNHQKSKFSSSNGYRKEQPSIKGQIVCSVCNDLKPVSQFRLHKKVGFTILDSTCIKCRSKQWLDRLKKDPEVRKKWNSYWLKWYREKKGNKGRKKGKPIQELWNKANKKRYAKEKETLADSYIRRLLARKTKSPTPEQIMAKREELFEKRRMANISASS